MHVLHSMPFLAAFLATAIAFTHCAPARADLDAAWFGAWMGEVASPAGVAGNRLEMPVTVVVEGSAQSPSVSVTCIRAGAMSKPVVELSAAGRAFAFTLDSQGRKARFEGEVDESGTRVGGSFAFVLADGTLSAPTFVWSMRRVDPVASVATAKVYGGTLEVPGQKLAVRLAIGDGPHGPCGAIDIVAQGVRELAVEVERTADGFRIELPLGTVATMELKPVVGAADALGGVFRQGTFAAPIRFDVLEGVKPGPQRRPQDPVAPFPYGNREVHIAHPAGHDLAGTLSIPSDMRLAREGRVPAVVLVTGSGPQNRDEELLGHRPFAVIADALARAGIAVLRYDDRGIGASSGAFAGATTVDFASDADVASEWLKRQQGIDPARVGMLGHSEGAVIAPIVSAWQHAGEAPADPLAFVVLLAAPAETGGATLTRQSARLYEIGKLDPAKSARAVEAHRAVMQAVAAHADESTLRPLVSTMVAAQIGLQTTGTPPASEIDATVNGAIAQLADPWMSEFIRIDPRAALVLSSAPTLALWGSKDFQVVAEPNRAIVDGLVAKHGLPVTVRVYEGLNHLFQPAGTGGIDEYGTIETTIDPKVLADIAEWIARTTAAPAAARANPIDAASAAEYADELPRRLWIPAPATATEERR